MKIAAVAVVAALLIGAAGCSSESGDEPEGNRVQSAVESLPQSAPEQEPAPEPVELVMTDEEAGSLFLEIVCGVNATVYPYNDAINAAEEEYLAGGNPDMSGVTAAAKTYSDAVLQALVVFDDPYYVWPESVNGYIRQMRDGYFGFLDPLHALQQVNTYDGVYSVVFPTPEMPAQKIRYELSLDSDVTQSCVDHGGSLAELAEESKARDKE